MRRMSETCVACPDANTRRSDMRFQACVGSPGSRLQTRVLLGARIVMWLPLASCRGRVVLLVACPVLSSGGRWAHRIGLQYLDSFGVTDANSMLYVYIFFTWEGGEQSKLNFEWETRT